MFQKQCRNLREILYDESTGNAYSRLSFIKQNYMHCTIAPFCVTANYCHERFTSGFTVSHQELLGVTSLAQSLTNESPFDWAKSMASERHSSLVTSIESPSSSVKVS